MWCCIISISISIFGLKAANHSKFESGFHNIDTFPFVLGWLYLTVNHLAFYSFILGTETKILVRWTDVVEIEALPAALLQGKTASLTCSGSSIKKMDLVPDSMAHCPSFKKKT